MNELTRNERVLLERAEKADLGARGDVRAPAPAADTRCQNIHQQDDRVFRSTQPLAGTFLPPRDPGAYLTAEDRAALARLKDAVTLRNAAAATMNKAEQAMGAAVAEMRRLGFEGDELDRLRLSGRVFHDLTMPAEIKKAVTFRMEG